MCLMGLGLSVVSAWPTCPCILFPHVLTLYYVVREAVKLRPCNIQKRVLDFMFIVSGKTNREGIGGNEVPTDNS